MPWLLAYIVGGWIIRLGMVLVILRRQWPAGTALAWLSIVFFHPYIGGLLYLLIGERWLGRRYARRHRERLAVLRPQTRDATPAVPSLVPDLPPAYAPLVRQLRHMTNLPILAADTIDLFTESKAMVDQLVADIDAAKSRANLLYFIFAPDGTGQRICDALVRAAKRGVQCRLLVDAVGSRPLLHNRELVRLLGKSAVHVVPALPVAPLRRQLARMDLRNHRKLAIIDNSIAYVGSHNLINPDYGGRKGGPWHDLTGRFSGPVVRSLAAVFVEDWFVETGEQLDLPAIVSAPGRPGTPAQVVPTGPESPDDSYRRVLLAVLQSAQERVTLTSPYFVPDEPTLVALMMAADRGVEVTLILPLTPDHAFTAAAGRSHFEQLLGAGVAIYLYRPGLVHSKSITVDDAFAVFGSANLDLRSFNLDFELSVVLYGSEITNRLRDVQSMYIAESTRLSLEEWAKRSIARQYAERALALLSPLL